MSHFCKFYLSVSHKIFTKINKYILLIEKRRSPKHMFIIFFRSKLCLSYLYIFEKIISVLIIGKLPFSEIVIFPIINKFAHI